LEAEGNMKKAAEDRSAGLSQELENMRAQFLDLQVSNERLSQQVATLQQQVLKDLKYPLVDQLESLKDVPMDVITTTLYLESDTGDDALQDIRDLRPSSSQLNIPVYLE
nr:hypothetical protein [Tanacetum cinerariifolium]